MSIKLVQKKTKVVKLCNIPDWITPGITKSSIQLKDLQSINKLFNCSQLKLHIKRYKKIYSNVIRAAKELSISTKIKNYKGNKNKIAWDIIKKESSQLPANICKAIKSADNKIINDPIEIVNLLNSHFSSIACSITANYSKLYVKPNMCSIFTSDVY